MKLAVFTICSANYLSTAKVLLDSLAEHESNSRRILVLVEREWPVERLEELKNSLGCEVMPLSALNLPQLEQMAFQYDVTEFNTAVKPFVFQTLFDQGEEAVIYLDPDICLYQPLTELWQQLAENDAIVTPHLTEPLPDDGLAPTNENMVRCGQYNFGFVGFSRGERSRDFIDWWAGRLTNHCIFHPLHFYFVDQFYGALVSSFIPRTRVWHHQGYNFAYWNAPQRSLTREVGNHWTTPDGPLVFFHFSGFTHQDPAALSRHQNRMRAEAGSPLEEIAIEYAAKVQSNADAAAPFMDSYSFGHYDDRAAIDPLERRAYRDLPQAEKDRFGHPFRAETRERLGTYVEIDDGGGSAAGLLWQSWAQRDQLRQLSAEFDEFKIVAAREKASLERVLEDEQRAHVATQAVRDQVVLAEQKACRSVEEVNQALQEASRARDEANQTCAEANQARDEANRAHAGTLQYVAEIERSLSYRIGRSITAPARLSKNGKLRKVYRGCRAGARRVVDYQRQNGTRRTLGAVVRLLRQDGIRGMIRNLRHYANPPAVSPASPVSRKRCPGDLAVHTESVDIIVCVHNALQDVQNCLESVLWHTTPPYRLILVDDGSQAETRDFLNEFAKSQGLLLLRNEEAKGYTLAANQGLRASSGDFVVLLNSDTIVTPSWIDRMLRCARSNPRIGAVGPLSNTASWQSVPMIFDAEGDWADNPLPEGVSIDDMARQVAAISGCQYPQVGFLNGFCYMIRREVLDTLGLFDEVTFAKGYGEENDYCLRLTESGWQMAVADDTYVYHAQSRSYSNERRAKLVEASGAALIKKHGNAIIGAGVDMTRGNLALAAMRARVSTAWASAAILPEALLRFEGQRILFLLPVTSSGGGGNVVIQEALAMMAMGVDVRIVNLAQHRYWFELHHPGLEVPVEYIETPADLDELLDDVDAVVATLYVTVEWIAESFARRQETRVRAGYYIQDFEPHFFAEKHPDYRRAWDSYALLPDLIRITKTEWNRAELYEHCKVDAAVVGCSYDARLFMPSLHKSDTAPVNVVAMVRPSTPRRAPELTLQVLKALHGRLGSAVNLSFFGVHPDDAKLAKLDTDFPHTNFGELSPEGVADVLDRHDIFLDFSTYQAMGLTALEAMACGVAVVAPIKGGAGEFITDNVNGCLVDTSNLQACQDVALHLASDHAFRKQLQQAALAEAPRHSAEIAASRFLDALLR